MTITKRQMEVLRKMGVLEEDLQVRPVNFWVDGKAVSLTTEEFNFLERNKYIKNFDIDKISENCLFELTPKGRKAVEEG